MARMTLESTEVVNTPLLLARLSNIYRNNVDDDDEGDAIVNILLDGFSGATNREFSKNVFRQLLMGRIPYSVVNGNTVIFDTDNQQV